jgi:hypothetical protein
MDAFRQDLRYACRQLVRRPGFAAVAILSLALGIGGNTAVFGIVDSFVLHPFAFRDADRLVVIGPVFPKLSSDTRFIEVLSALEYEDIHRARSFASTAAFDLATGTFPAATCRTVSSRRSCSTMRFLLLACGRFSDVDSPLTN